MKRAVSLKPPDRKSQAPAAPRRVLAAAFFAAALSAPGQTFFVSLYIPEIVATLGLSTVRISTVYGAATLAGAALLPLVGAWADYASATRYLGAVMVGLGLSLLALAYADGPGMLLVAWTLARCLGQGAVGVGVLVALSRAFEQNRGRALAAGNLGHPAGEFIFPAAIAVLLAWMTWRQSLLIFASLYVVIFAPLVAAGLRSVPRVGESRVSLRLASPGGSEIAGLHDALRMRVFWIATVLLTAAPVVVTALLFHQVAFFEGAGLSRIDVPIALMYFAAAQIGATILTGRMVDRGSLKIPLALSCVALFGSTLCLIVPLPASARIALYGGALGYATGAAGVAGAALWPAYFGVSAVGRVRAVTSGVRNAATAGAPVLLALVIEHGGLQAAHVTLAAVGALALVLTWWLPAPPTVGPRRAQSDLSSSGVM